MENELDIIAAAKIDPMAFGQLYDVYYPAVFGFLLSRTHHVEVAKDLTSETFFHALKSIHRYEPRGKPFKSWLFAIAVAQIGNHFRAQGKARMVEIDETHDVPASDTYLADTPAREAEDLALVGSKVGILRQALKKLNATQQSIVRLRFFKKQSITEIAEELSMKEGTVKSHIHRSLKALRGLLGASGVQSPYAYESVERIQDLSEATR